MQSLFGSNVDLPYIRDYGRFLEYHRELDPAAMTLIADKVDQKDKLKQTAADLPNATHLARIWHELDGAFHLPPQAEGDNRPEIASAEGYVEEHADLGQGNMILSLLNEPTAFNDLPSQVKLVNWCVRAIRKAAALPKQPRICLPHWGDRNPFVKNGMWAPAPQFGDSAPEDLYDALLLEAAKHPEMVSICLHLYGPDTYVDTLAGLVGRCALLGIRCPDTYISEFGDDTAFNGDVLNGYKTRIPSDTFARWNAQQIAADGALRPYGEARIVKGVTIFGYAHTARWIAYDTETDRVFQITMLSLKKEGKLSISDTLLPQAIAKPTNAGIGRKVVCRKFRNIRSGPSTRYHDDGDLPVGAVATVYDQRPQPEKLADGSTVNWWWMESENGNGWIQSTGWVCENVPDPAPAPVDPPIPVPPVETWPPAGTGTTPAPEPVKLWSFGIKVKATESQIRLMQMGFEKIMEGIGYIGLASGAVVDIEPKELTPEAVQ